MKRIIFIALVVFTSLAFSTKLEAQAILDINPNEGLYEQAGTGEYTPMQYPPIREADVMWRKRIWRTIDFRQKMNQVFYYPTETHYNWNNFMQIIIDEWKVGDIVVYAFDDKKDELHNPMTYNSYLQKYGELDYVDENSGDSIRKIDIESIQKLNIMEDWYFDRQRSQLMVRILAIGPVINQQLDGQDNWVQMCWVSYNDATRRVFAKSNFFNRDNPGAVLNYDQVFMMRLFDSYIYKEENPYDRKISDYYKGVKALYESDRIKQEIIDFEQNLWEY